MQAPGSEEEAARLLERCGEMLGAVHSQQPQVLGSLWEATSGSMMGGMVYPDGAAAPRHSPPCWTLPIYLDMAVCMHTA